jgi:hypothetical protein
VIAEEDAQPLAGVPQAELGGRSPGIRELAGVLEG